MEKAKLPRSFHHRWWKFKDRSLGDYSLKSYHINVGVPIRKVTIYSKYSIFLIVTILFQVTILFHIWWLLKSYHIILYSTFVCAFVTTKIAQSCRRLLYCQNEFCTSSKTLSESINKQDESIVNFWLGQRI